MNSFGATIGAVVFLVAYSFCLAAFFEWMVKKYPRDKGIRFGYITLTLMLLTVAGFRIPELTDYLSWFFPVLAFTMLILVCVTIFFLIEESVLDARRARAKHHREHFQ